MFSLVLSTVLILPLIGIWQMESGAIGLNIVDAGHPNGATAAYLAHLFAFVATFSFASIALRTSGRIAKGYAIGKPILYRRSTFRALASSVLAINLLVIGMLLLFTGAADVITGSMNKGEFRSQLGPFGVIAFLSRDFIIPMLCALVAFVYRDTAPTAYDKLLLWTNLCVTAFGGAIWGGKATAILKVVPALLVLKPTIPILPLAAFSLLAIVSAVLLGTVFDGKDLEGAFVLVLARATVGEGDTAWKIWDLHENSEELPAYWPTLLSALGGRAASVFGIFARGTGDWSWYEYDFSALVSLVVKNYEPTLEVMTSNVTATVFGEGVIAFGSPGYLIMSILAGVVVALSRHMLDRAQQQRKPLLGIFAANFFGFSVVAWLDSGGITTLINLPHVVSYILVIVGANLLLSASDFRRDRHLGLKSQFQPSKI